MDDYDVYLDAEFDPIKFANSLVVSTTASTDKNVDLEVPQRKVGYDAAEVDQAVLDVAKLHHKELLACAQQSSSVKSHLSGVKSGLNHVSLSYNRLVRDVVRPYQQAHQLYTSLKRLHATSNLLNNLVWYLHLARQLDALQSQSIKGGPGDAEALYRAQLALDEIHSQIRAHPVLCSVQIVRAHSASLKHVREQIVARAIHYINTFSLVGPDATLRYALLCLAHDSDKRVLANATQAYCQTQTNITVSQLAKALPRGTAAVASAAQDARNRARCLNLLQQTIQKHELKSHLDSSQSVVSEYWRNVASGLNSAVRDLTTRSPGAVRTLDHAKLRSVLEAAVYEGGGTSQGGLEARVLVGALNALKNAPRS